MTAAKTLQAAKLFFNWAIQNFQWDRNIMPMLKTPSVHLDIFSSHLQFGEPPDFLKSKWKHRWYSETVKLVVVNFHIFFFRWHLAVRHWLCLSSLPTELVSYHTVLHRVLFYQQIWRTSLWIKWPGMIVNDY